MWVRGYGNVLFVISTLHLVSGKPHPSLYNLPRAVASLATTASASASSSSPDTSPSARFTNIVDYRRKEEKAQVLQSEKQLVEDDDITDDDASQKDMNEATPSFIQKKINKILAKIQLFSRFSASSEPQDADTGNNATQKSTEETPKTSVKIEFEELTTPNPKSEPAQKIIYPNAQYGVPLKINLNIRDVENVTEIESATEENCTNEENMNRIGQFGVYVVELLGSLVGLAYGAMAHINNALNGAHKPETAI